MINEEVLKRLIKAYLCEENNLSLDINDKDLFKLANALNVSSIIAYTLKRLNIKSDLFDTSIYKAISNYERLDYVRNNIIKVFNDNNIEYLLLKGSSISKYYVKPYLRYSADIDVIVKQDHYDKAYNLMVNNLEFKCVQNAIHEKTLTNKQGVSVDFHNNFLLDKPEFEGEFIDCFNDKHELDDNYNYLFHLVHGAMHLVRGQMELRYFTDLFYLRKHINTDITCKVVDRLHLSKFEEAVNSYLDSLLGLKEYSNQDRELDAFIVNYAKDAGASNRVLNNSDNKASYFIHHIFPSFNIMKGKYPILNNWPILLPIMYVIRLFRVLFSNRRKYALNELKEGLNSDKTSNIINNLGLDVYQG